MNILNVCRICLCADGALSSLVQSITPKIEETSQGVLELWKIYSRILIAYDASFPDLICSDCTENIQQTYLFMMKCEKCHTKFQLLNPRKECSINFDDEYVDISKLQNENLLYEREQRKINTQTMYTTQSSTRLSSRSDINSEIQDKRKECDASENLYKNAGQVGGHNESNSIEVTKNLETTLETARDNAEMMVKADLDCILDVDTVYAIAAENSDIQSPGRLLQYTAYEEQKNVCSQANHSMQNTPGLSSKFNDNSRIQNKRKHCITSTHFNKEIEQSGVNKRSKITSRKVLKNLETTIEMARNCVEVVVKQELDCIFNGDNVSRILDKSAADRRTNNDIQSPRCSAYVEQQNKCSESINSKQRTTRLFRKLHNSPTLNKRKHCDLLKIRSKNTKQDDNREVTENSEITFEVARDCNEMIFKQEPECILDGDTEFIILNAIAAESIDNNEIQSSECSLKFTENEEQQSKNDITSSQNKRTRSGGATNRILYRKEVTQKLKNTHEVTCRGGEKIVEQKSECSLDTDGVWTILDPESTEDTYIQCPGCAFKCYAIDRIEKHVVESHIRGSMCQICNKEFACTPLKHCWEHFPMAADNLRKKYKSSKVKRSFLDIVFPFKCEYCMKPLRSKDSCNYHMLVKHGHVEENERAPECKVCCKWFRSNSALESHMRIHSGEKPYSCKFCGKKFVQKGQMIVHIRRHTGERPYKCMSCPKAFPDKSNFNKHLLSHTSEKPYPCRICLQRFQRESSLDLHYMCHAGEHPYECDVCSKKFKRRILWKKHMKTHSLSVEC